MHDGRSARNRPTGPGSRGGQWHDPEYRRAYYRAWRAAHPEYREQERIRRQLARGLDPARKSKPIPAPLPPAVGPCSVCGGAMTYVCDFCRKGIA